MPSSPPYGFVLSPIVQRAGKDRPRLFLSSLMASLTCCLGRPSEQHHCRGTQTQNRLLPLPVMSREFGDSRDELLALGSEQSARGSCHATDLRADEVDIQVSPEVREPSRHPYDDKVLTIKPRQPPSSDTSGPRDHDGSVTGGVQKCIAVDASDSFTGLVPQGPTSASLPCRRVFR
ncbi:hypothetical protein DPEC_G00242770 [Dallia pectoralis]|uniref:Uncharacterized protein n=1 Tax=Dallia pectoralis TaxID=75939 RepID=A0ACC2FVE2_DALPE|nr:hypothetical protein DPEC_G00242770 [Dallia pectoralis]